MFSLETLLLPAVGLFLVLDLLAVDGGALVVEGQFRHVALLLG